MTQETRHPVESIIIGDRYRKDMGDLAGLARSIDELGCLLHPIVITRANRLIAGARRCAAWPLTAFAHMPIPVTVVDLEDIARGEDAENRVRKDFLPSEAVAIARALAPVERKRALERQGARNDIAETFPGVEAGRTRDKVAKRVGISGRTLEKATAIVDAAEREPEKFGKLVEDMDRTGRVNGVHKRLKVIEQAEAIRREPPPLPNQGPYRCIVVDAPWPYEKRSTDPSHRGRTPYPTMSLQAICGLPVPSIADDDCVLWLWTTNAHMRDAFMVLDAWGFKHKSILTWAKPNMGTGDWLRGQTEHCVMAVRGKPIVTLTNQTTLLEAPAGKHSEKPDDFYSLVMGLCPAPRYAELFARHRRHGWDSHGDELLPETENGVPALVPDQAGDSSRAVEPAAQLRDNEPDDIPLFLLRDHAGKKVESFGG